MEIEVIPNTNLYEKDYKKFKMIRKETGETYYYVTLKNNGGRCPSCGKYVTKCKDLIKKKIIHDAKQIIYYSARRLKCECGKTFYEENPFVSKEETIVSNNLQKRILEELKRYNHTFLEVAKRFNLSVNKVIELFDTHVQIKRKALREVISVDEFYFSRRAKNKYAFMILGLNGKIIDILKSRRKSYLLDYFKYIPQSERDRVKYVTMDMNDELDRLRKEIMEKYKDKKYSEEYHLLKHHNNVLFKEDLDEEYRYSKYFHQLMNEVDYLNRILKIDPVLTKTYQEIKRHYYFNHYWDEYRPSEALDYINSLINEWFVSDNKRLIKLATTLDNWKEYIANSFIPYTKSNGETVRLSNGKIEGKNSYIKKMLKLANGYSNFDRFKNRTMYCENCYEIYSQEKLPNTVKRIFPKKKDQLE